MHACIYTKRRRNLAILRLMTINFFWILKCRVYFLYISHLFVFYIFTYFVFYIFTSFLFYIFTSFVFYIFTSFVFYIFTSLHHYIFTSFVFFIFPFWVSFSVKKRMIWLANKEIRYKVNYNFEIPCRVYRPIWSFCLLWHFCSSNFYNSYSSSFPSFG